MKRPTYFKGSETVEVKILDAADTKFNFDDIIILKGKKILSIETFNATDKGKTPNQNDTINDNAFKDGFLVIHDDRREIINRLSLAALRTAQTNGILKRWILKNIDWQKSYIIFGSAINLVKDEAALFTFYY